MSCAPPIRPLRSLRGRLTLLYAAVFAVAMSIVFGVLAGIAHRMALHELDDLLVAETRQWLDLAARRKARILQAEAERMAEHHGPGGAFVLLDSPEGEVLARAGPDAAVAALRDLPAQPAARPRPATVRDARGTLLRVLRLRDALGTRAAAGFALEEFDRNLRASAWMLAAACAASILLAAGFAWVLTGRAFGRIEEVRKAAEALAAGDLTRRLTGTDRGDEVAALSGTFNRMIERIADSIAQLRLVTEAMAHDFRTPLTRMRAGAELALQSGSGQHHEEILALVVDECDRLNRTCANLLQIARLDAGAIRPAAEPVPLDELVADAADLLGPAYADKGVQFSADGVPAGLCARGDRTLLERVLANLLDNALNYTPAGGTVRVTGGRCGEAVELAVSDTGIGIAASDQEKIFQRFFRSAPAMAGGSGLGLSFVQSAIHAMGGSIRLTSALGQGSTFVLSLPAVHPART